MSMLIATASVCFFGAVATHSLSASSSSITDVMMKAGIAETERLARYYATDDAKETSTTTTTTTTPIPTVWQSSEEASSYIRDHIDTILFDCDGVLYRTKTPCPGAAECIRQLMTTENKRVLFVTNNAGVNRQELLEKLSKLLDMDCLTHDQMITSSYASAVYLQRKLLLLGNDNDNDNDNDNTSRIRNRVHVIGSSGLCEELASVGFDVTGGPSLPNGEPGSMSRDELGAYNFDLPADADADAGTTTTSPSPIDALVVGHDTNLSFRKLCIADNLLLQHPEALFVATNMDSFDVVDGNTSVDDDDDGDDDDGDHQRQRQTQTTRHIMGNGATVVALEYSSRRKAINVGKPSRELFELIRQQEQQQIMNDNDNDNDETTNVVETNDETNNETSSRLQMDPSRCLFVGDRLDTDIKFGKDNGMKTLLVMTGVTTAQTLEELDLENNDSNDEDEPLPDFIVPYVGMLVRS